MEDIKYKLIQTYKNYDFDVYLQFIDEYMEKGYGFDYDMILSYAKALRKTRKFDKAYFILKSLEKQVNKYDIAEELIKEYLFCFKPDDALILYNSRVKDFKDKSILIKIYLLQGKVKEAKEVLEKLLNGGLINKDDKKIRKYQSDINNYYKYGSFIETEYLSFIKNGNKLEEGHVVFLKNSPVSFLSNFNDDKAAKRPYLIWKIDGNKVYMFPMKNKCNSEDFIISKEKYHNSYQDRTIKDSMCITNFNNILTVKDKLYDEDYKLIINRAFKTLYFGDQRQLNESLEFMKHYIGDISNYDIIEYIDLKTRENKYYLVIEIINLDFKVVEVNLKENIVLDYEIKNFNKYKGIFNIIKIPEDQKKKYLEQIENNNSNKKNDLSWKRVISKKAKYIVLTESDGICYCINNVYSPSYIQCTEILKEDIDYVYESLDKEEILRIRTLLRQTDTKNGVKKKIKQFIY